MSTVLDTFKRYSGPAVYFLIRFLVSLMPWIGYELALRHDFIPALWPPLGPFARLAIGSATISITLLGWILPEAFETDSVQRKALKACFILIIAAMICYAILGFHLVKEVRFPGTPGDPAPTPVYLSVGFRRTDQAKAKAPNKTDVQLIQDVGLDDRDIEKVWTHGSVVAARFSLFFTYFLFLAAANVIAGLNVKRLADPLLAKLPSLNPSSMP
jgi:hypothetical protein